MTRLMARRHKTRHPGKDVRFKYKYGLWVIFTKPIRKWFSATVVAPSIPYTSVRMCWEVERESGRAIPIR